VALPPPQPSPMLHPATLLVSWICFALILQAATLSLLAGLVVVSLLLAAILAPTRSMRLLRRSRWLLLSIGVLFLFFSPGEYLPGFAGRIGLTYEGVTHTGEQLGRLLSILLSLALLHERIGTPGLLAGLYKLLGPFPWRETTVVRLMLVLEFVEDKPVSGWREWLSQGTQPDRAERNHFTLIMPHMRRLDLAVMGGLAVATFMLVFR
jgi:hypothetical protein